MNCTLCVIPAACYSCVCVTAAWSAPFSPVSEAYSFSFSVPYSVSVCVCVNLCVHDYSWFPPHLSFRLFVCPLSFPLSIPSSTHPSVEGSGPRSVCVTCFSSCSYLTVFPPPPTSHLSRGWGVSGRFLCAPPTLHMSSGTPCRCRPHPPTLLLEI